MLILFGLYGNLKFPLIIFFSVMVTEPVSEIVALRDYAHQLQRLINVRFREAAMMARAE